MGNLSVCLCLHNNVTKLYTSITCKKHHSVMALQSTLFFLVVLSILSEALSFRNNSTCPTWMYRSDRECTCGSSLINIIICDNHTQEVSILDSFCLTSSGAGSDPQKAVVGSCLYGQNQELEAQWNGAPQYIEVNSNITKQDQDLCEPLNRQGKLCGTCKPNYFVSAYSYDMKCYQCNSSLFTSTLVYLTVAYLPLTIFLVIVMAFHISVASPRLHLVVLLCQVYTLPEILRVIIQNLRHNKALVFLKILASLYGVWNLDFFRTLLPPICLPLNTLQILALDYLIALYPLVLLLCFYLLVLAHDKGYRVVVRIWRPFLWCSARMRQQWNTRHSVIDAFSTFILLSYMRFLNTSIDLMIATSVFDVHGSNLGTFLYYNSTIAFMGRQHLPYATLAIIVLIVGSMFPLLLLLYPMKRFQKLLNKCKLNSPGLRAFMECFQGNYSDRTEGGRECRYFSAVYPTFRIAVSFIYAFTRTDAFFQFIGLFLVTVVIILQVAHPYKKAYSYYNKLDTVLLVSIVGFQCGYFIYELSWDWYQFCYNVCPTLGISVGVVFALVPLFYFSLLIWKKKQHLLKFCSTKRRRGYESINEAYIPQLTLPTEVSD